MNGELTWAVVHRSLKSERAGDGLEEAYEGKGK
jgi:hypothetical protein